MGVTIKDVARESGYSISTVSLVLGKRPHRIPKETQDKIFSTAKRLNYRINRLAAGLVTKRTMTLGLIVPDISNAYFAKMASLIEDSCTQKGYSLFLCPTNDQHQKQSLFISTLLAHHIDGVFLVASLTGNTAQMNKDLKMLQDANIPIVLLDRAIEASGLPTFCSDNEEGAYQACMHLLELGHRKIGCIAGSMVSPSSKERVYGYIRALQQKGIPFTSSLVYEGDYRSESGMHGAEMLTQKDVTAIFCCNDMMALGGYKYLRDNGLSVPDDISLVGYDDMPFTEYLDTPLTTVRQPLRKIAGAAVDFLMQMLQGTSPAVLQDLRLEPKLVIRESTAPPFFKTKGVDDEKNYKFRFDKH